MVQRLRAVVAAMAVAMLAAACGTAVEEEQRVLRVVMADDWAGVGAVVDAVRAFEAERPGVRVQMQGIPFSQIPDTVRAGISAGEPHDVAQWHAFAAAAEGLAEPIEDLRDQLPLDEYLPGAVVDVTWAGALYGVPLDTNALVMIGNPELLQASGAATSGPATFGDFLATAQTVSRRPDAPDVRGVAVSASSWSTYGWIRANGGEVVRVADDGTVEFTLDSPEVVEAVAFLGSLIRDGLAFSPLSRDRSTGAFALFQAGSAALHYSGTWDVAALRGTVDWEPVVSEMPRGATGTTRGSALGGSSMFVPMDAPNRELAVEFMLHLTQDRYALRLAAEEGRLPAKAALFDAPQFDTPAMQTVRRQLQTATPMLLIAFPEASEAFKEAVDDVLTQRSDAASALARAQERAVASLGPAP